MLDAMNRGLLEKSIDEAKVVIPTGLMMAREISNTQYSEAYIMGAATGYILGKFLTLFHLVNDREPNNEESREMHEVIKNRKAELREAILKAGAEPRS
jgi:hypothetical protein